MGGTCPRLLSIPSLMCNAHLQVNKTSGAIGKTSSSSGRLLGWRCAAGDVPVAAGDGRRRGGGHQGNTVAAPPAFGQTKVSPEPGVPAIFRFQTGYFQCQHVAPCDMPHAYGGAAYHNVWPGLFVLYMLTPRCDCASLSGLVKTW
jgi:hypothetical protein